MVQTVTEHTSLCAVKCGHELCIKMPSTLKSHISYVMVHSRCTLPLLRFALDVSGERENTVNLLAFIKLRYNGIDFSGTLVSATVLSAIVLYRHHYGK